MRLKQNPHFYEVLPTLAEYYGSEIQIDPIDLQTETDEKIDVLTDDSSLAGRVYLETDKEKRAFGNVWALEKAIIFRGTNLYFIPFSRPLTSCQTSVEYLRVKSTSRKPLKAYLGYRVLRSLRGLPPLSRRIRVTHRRPRHQRLLQDYQMGAGRNRFAECFPRIATVSTFASHVRVQLRLNRLAAVVVPAVHRNPNHLR